MKIVCYCYTRGDAGPVMGAAVSLYKDGKLSARHKTDLTGRCVFLKLERGEYSVRETEVPDYLSPSQTVHRFDCGAPRFNEVGFASSFRT